MLGTNTIEHRCTVMILVKIAVMSICSCTIAASTPVPRTTSMILRYSAAENVCMTAKCQEIGSEMRMIMNRSVDPCEDFYEYACGNWGNVHPMPDDESSWNNYNIVGDRVLQQIKEILEKTDTGDVFSARRKTKVLYKACMDLDRMEKNGISPMITALERAIGGWPILTKAWNATKFNWFQTTKTNAEEGARLGLFLSWGSSTNDEDPTENIINFYESGLGIGPREYFFDNNSEYVRVAYKQLMRNVIAILHNLTGNDSSELMKDVNEIYEFEEFLASLKRTMEDDMNLTRSINKMTLEEFHKCCLSDSLTFKELTDYLLESMPTSALKELIKPTTTVNVPNPDYFIRVHKMLAENSANATHKRILANYIGWMGAMQFLAVMTKQLRDVVQVHDRAISGSVKDTEWWKVCANMVNGAMDTAVGSLYVNSYFNSSSKEKVGMIITDVRQSFSSMLKTADWMDESTRIKAINKLESMLEYIAYPDYIVDNVTRLDMEFENLDFGPDHIQNCFRMNTFNKNLNLRGLLNKNKRTMDEEIQPALVNAFYDASSNIIAFPAGYLQSPFFDADRPEYLNYASLGATIGHEVIHGFDDTGSQFDNIGKFKDWWSQKSRAHYQEKADGLVKLYNNYQIPEGHVNGYLTLGENIADFGGDNLAFNAYQLYTKRTGKTDKLLPGFENSTVSELFFLAMAQDLCGSQREESARSQLLADPHSPLKIRVLGPLSNMPEFSKVYNCPSGSAMNSKIKHGVCFIYGSKCPNSCEVDCTSFRFNHRRNGLQNIVMHQTVNDMREVMNQAANPRDDFCEYACGNWSTMNAIPDYQIVSQRTRWAGNKIANSFTSK